MAKKYIVTLTDEEREELQGLLQKGTVGARKLNRAHILLLADEGESDEEIAAVLHSSLSTVQRTRQRFVEEGFEPALHERRRPGKKRLLQGRTEAFLVAFACSDPPSGRKRWTMSSSPWRWRAALCIRPTTRWWKGITMPPAARLMTRSIPSSARTRGLARSWRLHLQPIAFPKGV